MNGITRTLKRYQCRAVAIQVPWTPAYPPYNYPIGMEMVDGWIIINDAVSPDFLKSAHRKKLPVISINRVEKTIPCTSVIVDNHQGMRIATEHLIQHGHRNIAFIGDLSNPNMQQRFAGYQQALEEHGISYDPAITVNTNTSNYRGGFIAADSLIAKLGRFTAFVAGNDIVASGFAQMIEESGRRIPDDIAYLGFNNDPNSRLSQMSTVQVPAMKLGETAVEVLLRKIQWEPIREEVVTLPCQLVIRESCGCDKGRSEQPSSVEEGLQDTSAETDYLVQLMDQYRGIAFHLIRTHQIDLRSLAWMMRMNIGSLAFWQSDKADQLQLKVDRYYSISEYQTQLSGELMACEQFPPRSYFNWNSKEDNDIAYINLIRTERKEWGLLTFAGRMRTGEAGQRMSITLMSLLVETLSAIMDLDQLLDEAETQKNLFQTTAEQIKYLAYQDSLTGLLNRRAFNEKLKESLKKVQEHGGKLGLILFDLDRFKMINDSYGHHIGDQVLIEVAERMSKLLPDIPLCRLGGDEFILLLPSITRRDEVAKVGQQIIEALHVPFHYDQYEFHLRGSFGACIYPDDGEDMITLMKNADIAMYRAKANGNPFEWYRAEMNFHSIEWLNIDNGMRKALQQHEFELYYQPQVDMRTGKLSGVEALVRWHSPERGMVPPKQFIPVAEETGLILSIGEWVLTKACLQMRDWKNRYPLDSSFRCSINISGRQFEQQDFITHLRSIIRETGVDPNWLCLEITESTAIKDMNFYIHQMHELMKLGIHVALDDFGTGYSSLDVLRRLPVKLVKIHKSFIKNIATVPADWTIVNGVISLSHTLNRKVIAEGVENERQWKLLKKAGCDYYQGYLCNKPISAKDFEEKYLAKVHGNI